jgi:aminopeptidase B
VPIHEGIDPEDSYNDVPYEKGYAFVCYLREQVRKMSLFFP